MNKTFQELDLSNAFLFAAALEDPETCQLVLEIILGCKVSKVKPHAEHTILINSDFRSVRMDIYATDEIQVGYNVEAQNRDEGNLPKRSRYYQAEMDVSSLKPGDDFNDLKPSYVIFICTFDPFGEGLYRYTFEERCIERNIGLGDGTKKIFLSTKGKNDDEVPTELIHFLKYVESSTDEYVSGITDESIIKLHDRVMGLKKHRKLEARFMTLEEYLENEIEWRIKERTEKLVEELAEEKAKGLAEEKAKELAEEKAKELAEQKTKEITEQVAEELAESILVLLSKHGTISHEIEECILSEKNIDTLKNWLSLATQAESIEQFTKEISK